MFDIGFSELIVIGLVALVVLGPERLPKVARTAGHMLGRLQRYVNDVKADINREIQIEELRKLQGEIEQSARNFETEVTTELNSVESTLRESVAPPADDSFSSKVEEGTTQALPEANAESAAEPVDTAQMELGFDRQQDKKVG